MGAVQVNDEDPLKGTGRWAGGMLVAEVKTESQFEKTCTLVKTVLPNLQEWLM